MTVILLVVLSLSIISLDLNGRTHSLTSGVKSVANDVYNPLRQGVVDIIRPIGSGQCLEEFDALKRVLITTSTR